MAGFDYLNSKGYSGWYNDEQNGLVGDTIDICQGRFSVKISGGKNGRSGSVYNASHWRRIMSYFAYWPLKKKGYGVFKTFTESFLVLKH